ncbi:MAG: DUF6298 domain-containing protein [Acidobacteria bacterium]|nr:DUF6298 domain-containing protein [Acidobacteriota bacterium]
MKRFVTTVWLLLWVVGLFEAASGAPVTGPLKPHPTNPRYFTDGSGKAIYLTGSHTWDNLPDIGPGDPPYAFNFDAYLEFLQRHNHNFIRLWRWEEVSFDTRTSGDVEPGQGVVNRIAPHPWKRTGPGNALDGKPKFNLDVFDPDYIGRLHSRVRSAGRMGIYVSVMLFEGWGLQHAADGWKDHPFHASNNVNGINGDADGDGRGVETHTLKIPAVTALQERYVRKVVDTLNDLNNVLYEISNESGVYSTEWQYHLVRFIKQYEKSKPKQHPVGMTFQWSRDKAQRGSNRLLFESLADWISPGAHDDGRYLYLRDPPAADGTKVILNDTDHLGGITGTAAWVWKSFCRGLNPIFMDPYDNRILGKGSRAQWDALRRSLGHTRRLAERIDLAATRPHDNLASTKYCMAQPGVAYIIYLPEGGEVTVDLSGASGTFLVEWVHPVEGTITSGQPAIRGGKQSFTAPFSGEAVLYLSRLEQKKQ